jgi:DNA-binding beta-propeller fold protein YncE
MLAVVRIVLVVLCLLAADLARDRIALGDESPGPKCLGPTSIIASPQKDSLFVLLADAKELIRVTLPTGLVDRRVSLPSRPSGLALSRDGSQCAVTCSGAKSAVLLINAQSFAVTNTYAAGHTAVAPCFLPNGEQVFVCNRFENSVTAIDLKRDSPPTTINVVREPVASAVTPNGKALLVANFLPLAPAETPHVDQLAAIITFIDIKTGKTYPLYLPSGSHSVRGLCVSPDGSHAYATHILSNFLLTPTQLDQGWANVNVLTVIDVAEKRIINSIGMDDMFQGRANPWGVATTSDGDSVCVVHSGSNELSLFRAPALQGRIEQLFMSPLVGSIPYQLRLEDRAHHQFELKGKGPREITVVGQTAYITNYFGDSISTVDFSDPQQPKHRKIALGPAPELRGARLGEFLFNDSQICYGRWQSCASCHPDGRTDAVNWDLLNDGMGTFKNTKSLLYAHKTPPSMAEGVRKSFDVAVRAGIEHILFSHRPEEEAAAIDAYVQSMQPVPSPYLVDGELSESALRGKTLFHDNRVGCFKCHPAPLYTDQKMHNVRSRGKYEYNENYDTPSLIEVWRTSPYLHDGRHVTIEQLIRDGKHGNTRGRVDELTDREIRDLAEFVLSL